MRRACGSEWPFALDWWIGMVPFVLLLWHGAAAEINPTPRVLRHRSGFAYVGWVTV